MEFIDTYQQLTAGKKVSPRERVRGLALDAFSTGYKVLHNFHTLFSKPRIQFLYIHHVFRDEEQPLIDLLEALAKDHTFISHTEGVQRLLSGTVDKPYIAVSSDDGLKNNMRAAAVLDSFGIKGCFFICPSIIGVKDFQQVKEFSAERLHFPPVEFMTWDDVHDLLRRGHEIGSHTLSHINIARSPSDLLKEEIVGCRETILRECGGCDHFAFPYGRFTDFTQEARELVFDSGYTSCSTAQRGCHIVQPGQTIPTEQLFIRRDHVILTWPLRHILYFIARNAATAVAETNFYTGYADRHPHQQS